MEFDTNNQQLNWADQAYIALRDVTQHTPDSLDSPLGTFGSRDKWPAVNHGRTTLAPAAFAAFAAPSVDGQATVERYGQVTPPEELSPAVPPIDPILPDALPWPSPDQGHDVASFGQDRQQLQPSQPPQSGPASKRRRTTRQAAATSQSSQNATPQQPTEQTAAATTPAAAAAAAAQQAQQSPASKRKRGRPKASVPQQQTDEGLNPESYPFPVSSARQSHLEKNRVAAHKCRERRKQYISNLETRASDESAKNKVLRETCAGLREQVLGLKNILLLHAGCGCWAIDQYLERSAGDLLGVQNPLFLDRRSSGDSLMASPSVKHEGGHQMDMGLTPVLNASDARDSSLESFEDFGLLNGFDDEESESPQK